MVHITVTGASGQGARFAHEGFLGLTPVLVRGVVATHVDSDGKPLPARALRVHVRCYEMRLSRFGQTHAHVLADHAQTLWTAPAHALAPLGEFEAQFRIVVPLDSPGASTAAFPDYRVFWRVEAAIEHAPIAGVGARTVKQVDLALTRYASPAPPAFSPGPSHHFLTTASNKPRVPVLRYRVRVPEQAIGPDDILSTTLEVAPLDAAVVIRSASVTVERRIELRDPPPPSNASLDSFGSSTSARPLLSSSVGSSTSGRPLLSSTPSTSSVDTKVSTTIIAAAESGAGRFARDANGLYTRTLALPWPAARSSARWALGETLTTALARVSFVVKARVIVSAPDGGTHALELADAPVLVVGTNAAQRRLALARWEASSAASTVSTPAPPYSADPPGLARPSTGTRRKERDESGRAKRTSTARPHTSGGGRPKTRDGAQIGGAFWRPGTARAATASGSLLGAPAAPPQPVRHATAPPPPPQIQGVAAPTSVVRMNTITGETTITDVSPAQHDLVRAWEEELARIEQRARRRSDAQRPAGGGAQRRSVRA